jgi:hypothetical protein
MPKKVNLQTISERELLRTRICDLPISIEQHKYIKNRINRLNIELKNKQVRFRPHVWISDDWFSPDGHPGFAIPFYLFHPKLIKLERKFIGFVEGTTEKTFLQLLRHETGHAIDNAFGLRRSKRRQKLFGLTKTKYPKYYQPNFNSKDYVFHLNDHYAQSHPDEDWAETFSVWLTPRSNWRKVYAGTKAHEKLALVDSLMSGTCRLAPAVKHRRMIDHFKSMRMTVEEYLLNKQTNYSEKEKLSFAPELSEVFHADKASRNKSASRFLNEHRKVIINELARETRQSNYTINSFYEEMIDTCRQKSLKLKTTERKSRDMFKRVILHKTKKRLNDPDSNKVIM